MIDDPDCAAGKMNERVPDDAPELARELERRRPTPAPAFRAALSRRLATLDPGYGPRPPRLRLLIAALMLPGIALLLVALGLATGVV